MKHSLIGEHHSRTTEPLAPRTFLLGCLLLALCAAGTALPLLHAPVMWHDRAVLQRASGQAPNDPWITVDWMPAFRQTNSLFPSLDRWRADSTETTADGGGRTEARSFERGARTLHTWIVAQGGSAAVVARLLALAFHFCSAVLVWMLARRLRIGNGFSAGILFAIHPVALGSLFWIHRLDATAGLTFCLLACWLHLVRQKRSDRRWWQYPLVLAAAAAAMLLTPYAIVLPLLMALHALWWQAELARKRAETPVTHRRRTGGAPAPYASDLEEGDGEESQSVRMSDEMEHEDWKKIHPRLRFWYHFRGRVERILFRIGIGWPSILDNPLLGGAAAILPVVLMGFFFSMPLIRDAYEAAAHTPEFARISPAIPGVSAWVTAWGGAWFHSLIPAGLSPLNIPFSLAPASHMAGWLLLPIILCMGVLAVVFRGERWAHYLFLFMATSLIVIFPAVTLPRPLSLPAIVNAEQIQYWLLPIPCLLVAALLGKGGKWWSRASLLLCCAAMAFFNAGRGKTFRDEGALLPSLHRQFKATPLGQTEDGLRLAAGGKLDEACAQYRSVLEHWPAYAPALDAWGQAVYQRQAYYLAVEKFENAVRLDPENPNHRLRLAEACLRWGMTERAMAEYARLRKDFPASPIPPFRITLAYLEQRMHREALGEISEAIRLDPGNPAYLAIHGLLTFACQDSTAAAASFLAALRLDPTHAMARIGLAWCILDDWRSDAETQRLLAPMLRRGQNPGSPIRLLEVLAAANSGNAAKTRELALALASTTRNDIFIQTALARILLLHPDKAVRSPQTALEILSRIQDSSAFQCTIRAKQALALACSATGNYAAAKENFQDAIKLAETRNLPDLAEMLRNGETLMDRRQPCCDLGGDQIFDRLELMSRLLRQSEEERKDP